MSCASVRLMISVLVITLAAFVSGGMLALVIRSPMERPVVVETDPALSRVARLYYDGVNTLLGSGDATELDAQLGPDFAGHTLAGPTPTSAFDLIADLQGIRSTRPQLRVTVATIFSSHDLVFASIQLTGESAGQFAGIPDKPLTVTTFDEVLRIADGRVVERWGSDWLPMRMLDVVHRLVEVPGGETVTPVLRRWEIAPNGFGDSPGVTWRFLLVESGSIRWSFPAETGVPMVRSGLDGSWESTALAPDLDAGDLVIVPPETTVHFTNPGSASAQMLVLDLTSSGENAMTYGHSEGITRQLVARGLVLRPTQGSLMIALGQFWLPSQGSWSHDGFAARGEMAFVTEGTLEATADRGLYWTVDSRSAVIPSHAPVIASDQALSIQGGGELTYSAVNGAPASGWIVTFSIKEP